MMTPAYYIPQTGEFFRNGKRCDYPHNSGYRWVFYHGKRKLAHIAAQHAMTGQWPAAKIDHRDRNPHNNAWDNLRPATESQNQCNKGAQRNNSCGEKNVFMGIFGRSRQPVWAVSISTCGHRFKWYASHKLSAILASRLIRRVLHGEFACD